MYIYIHISFFHQIYLFGCILSGKTWKLLLGVETNTPTHASKRFLFYFNVVLILYLLYIFILYSVINITTCVVVAISFVKRIPFFLTGFISSGGRVTQVQSRVEGMHGDFGDHYNGGPMLLDPQWNVKEPWGH